MNSSQGLLGELRLVFFSAPRVVEECEIRIMASYLGLSDCSSRWPMQRSAGIVYGPFKEASVFIYVLEQGWVGQKMQVSPPKIGVLLTSVGLQEWKNSSEWWRANQRAPHLCHWRHSGRKVGADTCRYPGREAAGTTPVRRLQSQGRWRRTPPSLT